VVEDADLVANNKDLLQKNKNIFEVLYFRSCHSFLEGNYANDVTHYFFPGSKIKIHQSSHSSKWQLLTLASSWTFVAYKVWGCARMTFFE